VVIENVERHIVEGITEPHNAASVAMRRWREPWWRLRSFSWRYSYGRALPGNHGNSLPAIRADHRVFRLDLGFQRTNPDSCAIGHFLGKHRERAKGRFFRWFNDGFNAGAGFYQSTSAGLWTGGWRRCCSFLPCLAAPTGSISAFARLHPGGRSRLLDIHRASAARGLAHLHARYLRQGGRGDLARSGDRRSFHYCGVWRLGLVLESGHPLRQSAAI